MQEVQETQVQSLESLMGYSSWSRKESDTTELLTLSLSQRLLSQKIKHNHIKLCKDIASNIPFY